MEWGPWRPREVPYPYGRRPRRWPALTASTVKTNRSSPRRHRRFKVTLHQFASFTVDVSAGGFCIELMGRVLQPGSAVEGAIQVGERTIPFGGRVAWARQGDRNVRGRMGVHFTSIPNDFLVLARLTNEKTDAP